MLAVTIGFAATGYLTVGHWVVASVLGFLVVVQMTAPVGMRPEWRRRLRIPLIGGIAVFVVFILLELWAQIGAFS